MPSLLDLPNTLDVTSGRVAIALALQHAQIGSGAEVLVPALHCDSMVAPVRLVDARAVFYRVEADAQVDFDDLPRRLTPHTRALILTHYFGFPQDLDSAAAFCRAHDLVLIEDCAHAFFGHWHGTPLGSVGDYAIASSMKFFPVFDGGILASNRHGLSDIRLRRPSLAFELKALSNVVERALEYDRLMVASRFIHLAVKLKDRIWKLLKHRSPRIAEANYTPASSEGSFVLDPAWLDVRMSRVSSTILRLSDHERVAQGRRSNYRYLLERLGQVPGLRPLYPQLPQGTVPLNFPVLVDDPANLFPLLKEAGVPIWRFGEFLDAEVTDQLCPNSRHLSRSVFQFPCHSELRPEELEWMIDTILAKLKQTTEGPAGAAGT